MAKPEVATADLDVSVYVVETRRLECKAFISSLIDIKFGLDGVVIDAEPPLSPDK